jgi:hypothetical protein
VTKISLATGEMTLDEAVRVYSVEYQRCMGERYALRNFNDVLLTYADLTIPEIRRLMFRV